MPAVLAFLKSPLGWAAIAALVAAIALAIAFHDGAKSGAASEVVKVQTRTKQVQGKINAAEAAGPRTPGEVSKKLRDGSF